MVDLAHQHRKRPDNLIFTDSVSRAELAYFQERARILAGYATQAEAQRALEAAYPRARFPRTFYGKYERMYRVPSVLRFEAISRALGLDIRIILPRLFLPDGSSIPGEPGRRHQALPRLYGPDGRPLARN